MTTGKQTALMPGTEDRIGYWVTPPAVLAELDREFHFNFDPSPNPRPAGWDGLKEDWGTSNYVNPPWQRGRKGSMGSWIRKAIGETRKGRTSVMLLPCDRWLHYLVNAGAELRVPPKFRFLNAEGKPSPTESRALILAVLRPRVVA